MPRKVAYSGKQKRAQLRKKRDHRYGGSEVDETRSDDNSEGLADHKVKKINFQPMPGSSGTHDPNKYQLHFRTDSREEIEKRKKNSTLPLVPVSEENLETDVEDVYFLGPELGIPKRPAWDYNMTKEQVDAREQKYFREYLNKIEEHCVGDELSHFELNIETWRQLWRVLEMSDILLIIVDIRFPSLLFPPALYNHVTQELHKDIILVLNKIDLAPAGLVAAWQNYFKEKFPELKIIYFTSFPDTSSSDSSDAIKRKQRGGLKMAAEGSKRLMDVCQNIVHDQVDLSSWKTKIEEELAQVSGDVECQPHTVNIEKQDTGFTEHIKYRNGILTIGCLGQPNVGKSSVINALMGRKVVSVSRTPGHTKYFQTIFLTPTVRLCDCPGLIFPSKVPQPLQTLIGCYPIAQVQEPYSSIRFLAERVSLQSILKLRKPVTTEPKDLRWSPKDQRWLPTDLQWSPTEAKDLQWSPFDICDAWAEKRGFKTAKTARHDVYRAANDILRMALQGRIRLCTTPPGYAKKKASWEVDSAVEEILLIVKGQGAGLNEMTDVVGSSENESSDSENLASDEESDEDLTNNKFSLLSNE